MEEIEFAFQPNRQYSMSKVKYGDIMTAITEFPKTGTSTTCFVSLGKNIFALHGMYPFGSELDRLASLTSSARIHAKCMSI